MDFELLQGENTSSLLFNFFLNDVKLSLPYSLDTGITTEQISIYFYILLMMQHFFLEKKSNVLHTEKHLI